MHLDVFHGKIDSKCRLLLHRPRTGKPSLNLRVGSRQPLGRLHTKYYAQEQERPA